MPFLRNIVTGLRSLFRKEQADKDKRIVGKVRHLLDGEMVRISGCVGRKRFGSALQGVRCPVLEPARGSVLRLHGEKRNRHRGKDPELFHLKSPREQGNKSRKPSRREVSREVGALESQESECDAVVL